MSDRMRKPAAFRLDDPNVTLATTSEPTSAPHHPAQARVLLTPEPDLNLPVAIPPKPVRRAGWSWGTLFWSALGGLVSLGMGLAVTNLIEDLYSRAPWLGTVGLALAALAGVALLVVAGREAIGLARLRTVERLRTRATSAMLSDDRDLARGVVRELLGFERTDPRLARGRSDVENHLGEIIDGADLIRLAERALMAPLDVEARRLVSNAAKRVSVLTAVSPRAAIDLAFVFITAVTLVRRLADLYGGRPGTIGLIRLMRHVITHLAVTGGMAAGDSIVQQVLGHGVAAKLSARLGEGVLNGLLTARLGLAAIEVVRPLPFSALPAPVLSDLAGDLIRTRERRERGSAASDTGDS